MNQSQTNAIDFLNAYVDPYVQKTWGEVGAVQLVENSECLEVAIKLGYPAAYYQQQLSDDLKQHLQPYAKGRRITIDITWQIAAHVAAAGIKPIPGVKNIIAVASGKGGVGKSTTAVNVAVALAQAGATVGLLDADIYGPNQPHMLGTPQRLQLAKGQRFTPVTAHGVQCMSMGYLLDPKIPMIWRGPMVSSALQQLAFETDWQHVDYLIVDLPPGTGDIQLTLSQRIAVNGAIIVTTPQEVAVLDARKGLEMFAKVNVPILGIVENMAMHICTQCNHQEAIFGVGGAQQLAAASAVDLLGQLPLARAIREQADLGQPLVMASPHSEIAKIYHEIALKIAAKLSLQPKSYAAKFPPVIKAVDI